jgi:hypothetical protein
MAQVHGEQPKQKWGHCDAAAAEAWWLLLALVEQQVQQAQMVQ